MSCCKHFKNCVEMGCENPPMEGTTTTTTTSTTTRTTTTTTKAKPTTIKKISSSNTGKRTYFEDSPLFNTVVSYQNESFSSK